MGIKMSKMGMALYKDDNFRYGFQFLNMAFESYHIKDTQLIKAREHWIALKIESQTRNNLFGSAGAIQEWK